MKLLYIKSGKTTINVKKGDKIKIIAGSHKNKIACVTTLNRKKGFVFLDIVLKNSKQQDRDLKIYYTNLEKI